MNDRTNAMRDYQQAIKVDSTYALAYYNAANVYFHTRQFQQVRKVLNTTLTALQTSSIMWHEFCGIAFQALGYYTAAIQFQPIDESAFLNRAITKVWVKHLLTFSSQDLHVKTLPKQMSIQLHCIAFDTSVCVPCPHRCCWRMLQERSKILTRL